MLLGPLILLAGVSSADDALPMCDIAAEKRRSVQVLTTSPGSSVDKIFGHTAILVYEPDRGEGSVVFDFGFFDTDDPALVLDVLRATQDYKVVTHTLAHVRGRLDEQGRGAVLQRLDLDPTAGRATHLALVDIVQNHPVFRYNWYGPNCTTRAADLIDEVMDGALEPQHQGASGLSAATQVLRHSAPHWPLWFGLHWGSGRVADVELSWWDAMFLPQTFMARLRESTLERGGLARPLVAAECRLAVAKRPEPLHEAPNRDLLLGGVGLAVGAGIAGISALSRRFGVLAVGLFGVGIGLFGAAALLVSLLGTFAPFWGNHNLWFASPVSGLLAVAALYEHRHPGADLATRLAVGVLAVAGLGFVASAIHGFTDRNLGIAGLVFPALVACLWVLSRPPLRGPRTPRLQTTPTPEDTTAR